MSRRNGTVYTLPVTVWITVFFVVPLCIILVYSFLQKDIYGGVVWQGSFDAYRSLFTPRMAKVAWVTLWMSAVTTALAVMIAIPCGYYIARSRHKNFLLFLVIIPFWTNFLIRIYAWIAILGNNGILNNLLMQLNITDTYTQFLYNQYSVIIVLVYTYLPFAILPLYSSIEKFDFSLLEAARDLGATKAQSIFKVLIPGIKGGLVTAVLFTFIPAFGNFAIPDLIGGQDLFMLGNFISYYLTKVRNWPLASSISMVITLVSTIGVMCFLMLNKSGMGAGTRRKEVGR